MSHHEDRGRTPWSKQLKNRVARGREVHPDPWDRKSIESDRRREFATPRAFGPMGERGDIGKSFAPGAAPKDGGAKEKPEG